MQPEVSKLWHVIFITADPNGDATLGAVGLQPFGCWDRGFEFR